MIFVSKNNGLEEKEGNNTYHFQRKMFNGNDR